MGSSRIRLAVVLLSGLAILTATIWIGYLGPGVKAKTYVMAIEPVLDDMIDLRDDLDRLFDEDRFVDADFEQAAEREEALKEI